MPPNHCLSELKMVPLPPQAVFSKVMSSSKALDILTKLSPISSRPAIKEVMERCMLVSFNKYGQELEGIQLQYEKSKAS